MSYRGSCLALLLFIFLEIFLTSIRPTWVDGGDIAHYILVGIHILIVLLEGIMVFVLFSSTIWFAAGLLGQLFFAVVPTLPCWVLRFVVCWLPWVYKRFVENGEGTPWSYGAYVFLVILDVLSCIALSVSLFYTMCATSYKRMYVPYHTDVVGASERESANTMNAAGFTAVAPEGRAEGGGFGDANNTDNRSFYFNTNAQSAPRSVGYAGDMFEMTATGRGMNGMVNNYSMAARREGEGAHNGQVSLANAAGATGDTDEQWGRNGSDAMGATRGPTTRNTSFFGGDSGLYPSSGYRGGSVGPPYVNNDSFAGPARLAGNHGYDDARGGGAFGLGLPPLSRKGSARIA